MIEMMWFVPLCAFGAGLGAGVLIGAHWLVRRPWQRNQEMK